jgi:DNA mismatch endonuclease (patch repair protein)
MVGNSMGACEDRLRTTPASPDTSLRMSAQRSRDTGPEMALRRELHRRGLRYRVHRRVLSDVRRTHDLVFPRAGVVVEVYGCWWHGCPVHGRGTKSNAGWWADKVRANRARDADTATRLVAAGWRLVTVWEHEDPVRAADRIEAVVRASTGRG